MEELICDEVLLFCQHLDNELGQPITLSSKFNISVVNALWTILAGKRYSLVMDT
jgi:hypothetical protein